MDAGYVSAFFGLAGAIVGGLTSFATTWLVQSLQQRYRHREAAGTMRHDLFSAFISEATRLYGDALSHDKDDVTDLVQLYALIARMRLVASPAVVTAADQVLTTIIETYLAPNRTLHEIRILAKTGAMNFLHDFGEACRLELEVQSIR